LQDLFDHFRFSQKLLGDKMIKAIQNNFSAQKVRQILQQEPTEEFKNKTFGKYNMTVEEAVETPTQRNLNYMQLMQARSMGIAIPDSVIIEAMPLQRKQALLDSVKQADDN